MFSIPAQVVNILGLIGVILSILRSCSFVLVVQECRKVKKIGNLNPIPIIMSFNVTLSWLIYGVLLDDLYIIIADIMILAGLQSSVTVFYLLGFEHRLDELLIPEILLYSHANLWAVVALWICMSTDNLDYVKEVVGMLVLVVTVLSHTLPIYKIPFVIRNKDSSSIYAPQYIIQAASCILWFVYGLGISAVGVWASSLFGLLMCCFFLMIKYIYHPIEEASDGKGQPSPSFSRLRVWTNSNKGIFNEKKLLLLNEESMEQKGTQAENVTDLNASQSADERSRSGSFVSMSSQTSENNVNLRYTPLQNLDQNNELPSFTYQRDRDMGAGISTNNLLLAIDVAGSATTNSPFFHDVVQQSIDDALEENENKVMHQRSRTNSVTSHTSVVTSKSSQSVLRSRSNTLLGYLQMNTYTNNNPNTQDPSTDTGTSVTEMIKELIQEGDAENIEPDALGMEIMVAKVNGFVNWLTPSASRDGEDDFETRERNDSRTMLERDNDNYTSRTNSPRANLKAMEEGMTLPTIQEGVVMDRI